MTDLATGISDWTGACARGALAACVAFACAGPAFATDFSQHPVDQFCEATLSGDSAKRDCVTAQSEAAELIVAYGTPLGYFTPEGDLVHAKIMRDAFTFKAFLGLPPEDTFAKCLDAEPTVAGVGPLGTFDMVSVWDCIKQNDPDAALLEKL